MNNSLRSTALVVFLVLSVLVTCLACTANDQLAEKLTTFVEKQPSDTTIEIKGMSQNYSLEKLVESSDLIVRGKITKILPSLKGTEGPLNIIYTDLIFEISDSIYGDSQFHNIAIRLWGGRIEKEVAVVDWEPILNVGEDVVLFLFTPPNDIQPIPEGFAKNNYYKITGSLSGKWVVTGDEITNGKFESKYDLSILRQKIADIRDTK